MKKQSLTLKSTCPWTIAFAASFVLTSCMGRELVRVDPVTETYISDQFETGGSSGVDVLVLVDNSGSMMDEQRLLTQNFPELIRDLLQPADAVDNDTGEEGPDGRADHVPVKDLHIGVVSSDMGTGGYVVDTCADSTNGDDGILQNKPNPLIAGCDAVYPMFLGYESEEFPPVRAPDEPAIEEIEKLANDFSCIGTLGNDGCGFEQQLEAVLKALTYHMEDPPEGSGENRGFLRRDTILAVLFMTDEEDCSVDSSDPNNLRIFDTTLTSELGHMNLRCFRNPEMIYDVDRYVDAFSRLRDNKEDFVMGLIVGVPPADDAPECNGWGKDLGACLDNDLMQALEDPENPGYMRQSCYSSDPTKGAYPPRRFIHLARGYVDLEPSTLGENVYVHSICSEDFLPVIQAITHKIHELVDKVGTSRELEIVKDASDPRGCTCMATCSIIETLNDARPCEDPKLDYDKDGDTAPDMFVDEDGSQYSLCEIPHSKMTITGNNEDLGMDCACCLDTTADDPGSCACAMECTDPDAQLAQRLCGETPCTGWWYTPYYDPDGEGEDEPYPTILLTNVVPDEGSTTDIQCRSEICPMLRQCGPGKCCDVNQYCYQEQRDNEYLCLVRPDVCAEFGNDLWCHAEISGLPASHNGICCLDRDMDGVLEMTDNDGDTLKDTPTFRCDGNECKER